MPRWLAHFLSVVFHPLLVPSYLLAALLWGVPTLFSLSPDARLTAMLIVAGSTFFLPAVGIYALVRAGHASSVHLPDHRERGWPLLLALAGFALAALVLGAADRLLGVALWLQVSAIALTWFITRYWLISAHAVGMGGAVGTAVLAYRLAPAIGTAPIALAVAIAGVVGAARLALNAHTPAQVWAGLGLGLAVGLVATVLV